MAEKERIRGIARQVEIEHMTPLERADGLGSVDAETARVLQKRRNRRARRYCIHE